mmetsp:Transcript_12384/g.25320  ORF Transcript_12384/g.25320 Transcript_12384/m.25320 type:complete len:783 (-) Transcript_12384:41-2389(-)
MTTPKSTITFFLSLALYLPTLCPTIAGGDAGELVAEGCQLGTAHPPGYPTFTIITYLISLLPVSVNVAYRMNVFSAVCGSLCSAIITHIVDVLTPGSESAAPAIAAGLFATISPLAWTYHVTAEVFALNNALVAVILLCLVKYMKDKEDDKWMYLGALFCGFGLTNQHTSILLIVPGVATIIYVGELFTRLPKLAVCAALFLAGFSSYATMPVFAALYPHIGAWGDVTSWSGWIHHFRRADYGTFQLFSGDTSKTEGFEERMGSYLADLASEQGGPGVFVLGLIGIFWCLFGTVAPLVAAPQSGPTRKKKRGGGREATKATKEDVEAAKAKAKANTKAAWITLTLVGCWIFYLCVFHSLANLPLSNPLLYGVHQRFWMQPNIFFFIFSGIGSVKLGEMLPKERATAGTAVLLAVLLAYSVTTNYPKVDLSDDIWFDYYARSVLEGLPPSSLLVINYDQQWTSVRYLQECEGVRPDIISINLSMMSYMWWKTKHEVYGDLVSFPGTNYAPAKVKGTGFTWHELLDANIDKFPGGIYLGGGLNYQESSHMQDYDVVPWGLSKGFVKKGQLTEGDGFKEWIVESRRVVYELTRRFSTLPDISKYTEATWEWTLQREYFDHVYERSAHLLELVINDPPPSGLTPQDRLNLLVEVSAVFELVLSQDAMKREEDYGLYKNLGLAYMSMIKMDKTLIFDTSPLRDSVLSYQGTDLVEFLTENGLFPISEDGVWSDGWREFASERWSFLWRTYLNMDGAERDGSYSGVKNIVEAVFKQVGQDQQRRKNKD